jgi:LysM repeat protein
MKRYTWIGLCAAALVIGGLAAAGHSASAQDNNLLVNGSLERPYYGQGEPTRTAPNGWALWIGAGAPNALPHNEQPRVRDGEVAWKIEQSGAVFTAAGYQRVEGLQAGESLTARAYGWVFTCNDTQTNCAITEAPYTRSDASAGASLKLGIDPTGGTDPNAAAIQWSAGIAPYDQWGQMTVTATVQGDAVTVFLYTTQSAGLAINEAYWDQVSLVRTSEDSSGGVEVPFVAPQGVRPDGSIVHVVQEGDTLSSIAFAYNKDYGVTVVSIADLNDNIKPNTRYLQIGQEIMILPPGSVDPQTGRLLPPEQRASTPTPTSEPEPAAEETEVPTEVPTEAPTEAPTEEPTEVDMEPTVPSETQPLTGGPAATEEAAEPTTEVLPTVVMPSATPLALADAQAVASRLTTTEGTLCVTVYQDANVNGVYDADEPSLEGAQVTLTLPDGSEEQHPITDAPLCLDLLAGRYEVRAQVPDGFGLTTADSAAVTLASGRTVQAVFGGAEGYTPPPAPEAEDDHLIGDVVEPGAVAPMVDVEVEADQDDTNDTLFDTIYDNSGYLVLGAAGVFLVGGSFLALVLRRR